jgi:hypothetical protein
MLFVASTARAASMGWSLSDTFPQELYVASKFTPPKNCENSATAFFFTLTLMASQPTSELSVRDGHGLNEPEFSLVQTPDPAGSSLPQKKFTSTVTSAPAP